MILLEPGRPNPLAAHYREFRVDERLLFTGHSHQAWPDESREAVLKAWSDAAELVDEKWARAAEQADAVRAGYTRLLGHHRGHIALGANTHELMVKLLSALDFKNRTRILTSAHEFYSARRQFLRLEEEGIQLERCSAPAKALGTAMAEDLDHHCALAFVSTVLFDTGEIVGGIETLAARCSELGVPLVVDVYHQLGALPFEWDWERFPDVYVVGGGYKYLQLGEDNGFLRIPPDCALRPVATGWFADFENLSGVQEGVRYADGPARFGGATYDPTSHYRAASVFQFFEEQGLTAAVLRDASLKQLGALVNALSGLPLEKLELALPKGALESRGAFLPLLGEGAQSTQKALRDEGVWTDARDQTLRIGPAPYHSMGQIEAVADVFARLCRAV